MSPAVSGNMDSLAEAPKSARLARLLASPTGVVIIVPVLVVSVGVVILLLGRSATRDASDSMARHQLTAHAVDVQHDVAFALDQAAPMLAAMRALADPDLAFADAASRMHALQDGRPGVTNVSIGFPSGLMRGTYRDRKTGELRVQESRTLETGTRRVNYAVSGRDVKIIDEESTDYDVRKRPHYSVATEAGKPLWMPPRVYFTSKTTGITCTEPVIRDGKLVAVTTIDFDVSALSEFIAKSPLEGARTIVFAADGTILAVPGAAVPAVAAKESRLLRHEDYQDPAISALFDGRARSSKQEFTELDTSGGTYLASIAPLGGKRANITAPIDWYLATLVPESSLLGPTRRFEKQTLVASAAALAVALGVALLFAWNLVRMRRAVTTAREKLRSAEAHARELGSYRLIARLGAGGMGEVWRAEHRLLARKAAVKLVRPEALARDPMYAAKLRERFRREAQTLAAMRSRNTIALYDYGVTDDGTFFFVMEMLDGLDLEKLVKEFGNLPAARVIDILIQACGSLAEAHDAGLLHRDIKPANLFVSRAADEVDVVKVLDFGIVQSIAEPIADPLEAVSLSGAEVSMTARLTSLGSIIGTPGYICPELALGEPVDARGDLYALGCVAWWLLTSTEVFARATADATILAHMHDDVPPLRVRVKGWLPDALEQLVLACLSKQPTDRPASARALADALRAIEIPTEHTWTGERAQAWWFVHRPVASEAPAPNPTGVRLLVPSKAPIDVEGPTIASRRPLD